MRVRYLLRGRPIIMMMRYAAAVVLVVVSGVTAELPEIVLIKKMKILLVCYGN